jgi:hypothetical protein
MKQIMTMLFSLLLVAGFSQDITNQLGNKDGSSGFLVKDSDGTDVFAVSDEGAIIGTGSLIMPIRLVNSNATISNGDYTILVDASAGNVTITFPTDLQISGPIINIKRVDEAASNDVILTDGTNQVTLSRGRSGAVLQFFLDEDGVDPDYTGWWAIAEFNDVVEP